MRNDAYISAVLSSRLSLSAHSFCIPRAPSSSFLMSYPAAAIGSSPAGVSTENRPPTLSGITNCGSPSAPAIECSAPFFSSVTTAILRFASSFPYFFSRCCLISLNAMAGSVVVPDFEMTTTEYSSLSSLSISCA